MIDIAAGSRHSTTVRQAQESLERRDYDTAATLYGQAVALTGEAGGREAPSMRRALWREHVGGLIQQEQLARAVAQADLYRAAAQQNDDPRAEVQLGILQAEALAALDDWRRCRHVLSEVATFSQQAALTEDQLDGLAPHWIHLQGLQALEENDYIAAQQLLLEAGRRFSTSGDVLGVRRVHADLQRLALLAVAPQISVEDGQTVNERAPRLWSGGRVV